VVAASPAAAPAPAATEAQPAEPPPPDVHRGFWTPRTATSIVLLGAGAVAAGVGVYFGVQSYDNEHKAEAFRAKYPKTYCYGAGGTECGAWNDAVNAENRDAQIARALYFVGGAFAVGAAVSWFFWPKPKPGVSAWVMPEVGQQAVGVQAGGRF
jgi:hypothetical protein